MAQLSSAAPADRSRSPPRGEKPEDLTGDKGGEGLEDHFSKLWASQLEPKLAAHAKATAEQAAEKNKEFEKDIQKLVGSFVKTEVDRLEKNGQWLGRCQCQYCWLGYNVGRDSSFPCFPEPPCPFSCPRSRRWL